jgi:regulator of RNase E activity RraA
MQYAIIYRIQLTLKLTSTIKVFARDVGTAPPYGAVKVVGVNVPVKLQSDEQDITINPGDYVIGDLNGVVVLPKDQAEKVFPMMEKQGVADAKMAVAITGGMSFVEASKRFRV